MKYDLTFRFFLFIQNNGRRQVKPKNRSAKTVNCSFFPVELHREKPQAC